MHARGLRSGFAMGGLMEDIVSQETAGLESATATSVDEFWMREALRESMKSTGLSNPNPAVGCVIVRNGELIAKGHTQAYGGLHAERHALSQVTDPRLLQGATAYVTLEPCSHTGRQPPCVEALLESPIERFVIGRKDTDPRVNGNGIRRLMENRKKVRVGFLENEITAWNLPFFHSRNQDSIFFALKWAQTLDGQLADDGGSSQWISGPESRQYTHWLRQRYDAIMVGAGTLLKDGPLLTVRDCDPVTRQPFRIIYDPRGRCLDLDQQTVARLEQSTFNGEAATVILVDPEVIAAKAVQSSLSLSVPIAPLVPAATVRESIEMTLRSPEILQVCGKPLQSVFIEGGPKLLSEFLRGGNADLIHCFIAPRLTGGSLNRVSPERRLADASEYQLLSQHQLGGDVLIELVQPQIWQSLTPGANV